MRGDRYQRSRDCDPDSPSCRLRSDLGSATSLTIPKPRRSKAWRPGGRMRGRKPIPIPLRLVGGNAGRRLLNKAEPAPEVGIPDPPAELDRTALAEWRRVAEPLYHAGYLTK